MKVNITYTIEEQEAATAVLTAIRPLLSGLRVHKNDTKPPFLHLYLTTKKPRKPRNSGEST